MYITMAWAFSLSYYVQREYNVFLTIVPEFCAIVAQFPLKSVAHWLSVDKHIYDTTVLDRALHINSLDHGTNW